MHITLEADYAVRIVYALAQKGRRVDAKSISAETGVTLRFALKILRKLVGTGIIKSFKGTQGGYELAKPAGEISLRDVIETVEGPYALSRCVDESFVCSHPQECMCRFNSVFRDISEDVSRRLAEVNFSAVHPNTNLEK